MGRYLVTGGAGFIGSHLVEALARVGHEVLVLDDFSTGRRVNLAGASGSIEIRGGDVRDVGQVGDAARGAEGIFHLAAVNSVPRSFEDPEATFSTNIGGAEAVVAAARAMGVRRVVVASSSSVYGDSGPPVRREADPPAPLSPYAESKLAAERICLAAARDGGPEVVCLRYFNVYGPRQDPSSPYAAAIPRFVRCFLRGVRPQVFGDGEQTRDFTYVVDIVDGTLAAMSASGAPGRVINLGAAGRISVNRLVALIRGLVGSRLEADHGPPRPGEPRHSVADVALARAILGYEPAWTLTQGLRATVAWYRTRAEVTVP